MGIKQKFLKSKIAYLTVLSFAAIAVALQPVALVIADRFDDQINALEKEISGYEKEVSKLNARQKTLKGELASLDAQKRIIQKRIDVGEVKLKKLEKDIEAAEIRLENQKEFLGQNLRSIYVESAVSPLEMVAASSSISDFVDRQEYRNRIGDKLKNAMQMVKSLKKELETKRIAAKKELADQKNRRKSLIAKERERATLLAQTQGQESAYKRLTRERSEQIAELRAQQAAENARLGGNANYGSSCGGGYSGPWPQWCNDPLDAHVDNWGMYSRECVSYTAYRVWASGRHMPYWGGVGNANQWDDNARAAGIPVDSNPKRGDVAVWNVGYYGHVMYVEHVNGDGSIFVSEYNYDWTGRYSTRSIPKSTWQSQGVVFIHF